ncbi:unnamed protein product [Agarophyton chilense]
MRLLLRRAWLVQLLALPVLMLLLLELSPLSQLPDVMTAALPRALEPSNVTFSATRVERRGVSLVACCMNRHDTLRRVLRTWRRVQGVDEIVLVDWGSSPPLLPVVRDVMHNDARIRLLRVDGEREWVLSRAYNLAMRAASYSTLLRTDCDYAIDAAFLRAHPMSPDDHDDDNNDGVFYAGNYAAARNGNEVHLNGAVLARRRHVLRAGGYDERIQTYGWDDEELYARLSAGGLRKLNVSYNHISHVEHGDTARAQHDVRFVQVEIDLNALLLQQLPQWNASALRHFSHQWAVDAVPASAPARYTLLHAVSRPRALKHLVAAEVAQRACDTALGQRLANDYDVPWDVMVSMDTEQKRLLLRRLNARSCSSSSSSSGRARLLVAHVMHGLGNRLRALGSAMAFANGTNREVVVVWESDAHLAANMSQLFEVGHMVVLSQFRPKWPFRGYDKYDKSWGLFDSYNYMEMEGDGAVKGQVVRDRRERHVYFKSAYVMEVGRELSHVTNWEADNGMVRSLRPVREVVDVVSGVERQHALSDMIGVHIRDRTLERDIGSVKALSAEYGAEATATMQSWRQKSSFRTFEREMERIVHRDKHARFFVAADTVAVLERLREHFGASKVVSVSRTCDGRDALCVRFALADLLCLGRTRALLGSNWSSFTEAASRLGGRKPRLAGVDF